MNEGIINFLLLNVGVNLLIPASRAIVFDLCGEGQEEMGMFILYFNFL
jgi:hypothetical protein